jgi:hypothetical protein
MCRHAGLLRADHRSGGWLTCSTHTTRCRAALDDMMLHERLLIDEDESWAFLVTTRTIAAAEW